MTLQQSIRTCFQKYFTFSGRACRPEFWWFWGSLFIASLALSAVGLESLSSLLTLATFIPVLAVAWRRMHDTDRSGAILLLPFAAMIAAMYVMLFSMLLPFSQRMAEVNITSETTIGELQKAQVEALKDVGPIAPSPLALVIVGAAVLWLIYLLTRPSTPGPNRFGPNPREATQ